MGVDLASKVPTVYCPVTLPEMTMTSPMCPASPQLVSETKKFASELEGVDAVEVKVVMDPPWTRHQSPTLLRHDSKQKPQALHYVKNQKSCQKSKKLRSRGPLGAFFC